jgi:hypothetical protein
LSIIGESTVAIVRLTLEIREYSNIPLRRQAWISGAILLVLISFLPYHVGIKGFDWVFWAWILVSISIPFFLYVIEYEKDKEAKIAAKEEAKLYLISQLKHHPEWFIKEVLGPLYKKLHKNVETTLANRHTLVELRTIFELNKVEIV